MCDGVLSDSLVFQIEIGLIGLKGFRGFKGSEKMLVSLELGSEIVITGVLAC